MNAIDGGVYGITPGITLPRPGYVAFNAAPSFFNFALVVTSFVPSMTSANFGGVSPVGEGRRRGRDIGQRLRSISVDACCSCPLSHQVAQLLQGLAVSWTLPWNIYRSIHQVACLFPALPMCLNQVPECGHLGERCCVAGHDRRSSIHHVRLDAEIHQDQDMILPSARLYLWLPR